jgi:hypothetical protein
MHNEICSGARQGQRDGATHAPSCAGYQGDLVVKWTVVHHDCIDITAQQNVKPVCFRYNPQIPQMTQITISSRGLCGLRNLLILRITYCGQIACIQVTLRRSSAAPFFTHLRHLRNLRICL